MNYRRFTSSINALTSSVGFANAYKVHLHVFLMMDQRPYPRSAWQVEEDPEDAKPEVRFRCHLLPEASSKWEEQEHN
jgi:hypothetical protein